MSRKNPITVVYDGSCPVCRHEIDTYRRSAAASGTEVDWCDISQRDIPASAGAMSVDDAARQMHVIDGDKIHAGVDAFEALWAHLPALRPFARLLRWPFVRPLAHALYDGVLAPTLYRLNRRRREQAQAARQK
jgi:predicted DCC family thiol-disulfide oxidoreductase YuxK